MSLLLKPQGVKRLSELEIDADKDWAGKGIANLKELALSMSQGDMNFRGAVVIEKLAAGIAGQYLKTQGLNQPPVWDDIPGNRFERLLFLTLPYPPSISVAVVEDHSGGGQQINRPLIVPAPPTIFVSELAVFDQRYEAGDDGDFSVYGYNWEAQTFTVNVSHDIEIIEIKCRRAGNPGDITIGIRATDGAGLPTGGDLTTVTFNGNLLATTALWIAKCPATYSLSGVTKYAMAIRAPSGDASNYLVWRKDGTAPAYAGGARCYSVDGGNSWSEDTNTDFMFREGEVK